MSESNGFTSQRDRWVSWWYSTGNTGGNRINPNSNGNDNNIKHNDAADTNNDETDEGNGRIPEEQERKTGWYSGITSKIPSIPSIPSMPSIPFIRGRQQPFVIDSNARYSQLSTPQIEYLEIEAKEAIIRRDNTWCWYEDLTDITAESSVWENRPGIVSVYDTGSGRCPLPFPSCPIPNSCLGYHVYIKNSLILPSDSPLETLHEQSWLSKMATGLKNYYNFPNERHLYLKKTTDGLLKQKKVVIISLVGNLPEKYEKFTLGNQRSAHYLATKLALSLKREAPSEIKSLSFECPLDRKELITVFRECIELLNNWPHILQDTDSIFVESVYHAVPLAFSLTRHILQNHESFHFKENIPVGILAIESPLQGYRFWDHSTDLFNSTEQDYSKIQQNREKQFFQGASKIEKEILSKLSNYHTLDSDESNSVQRDMNWLLTNWDSLRLNLFGKLFDNFMTVSQKLAIDYIHPKILRNLWCDGRLLGLDTRNPDHLGIPDINFKTPEYESSIPVPENRKFEISLMTNILLALNLGHTQFVRVLKLIAPFFISRSFNDNTISASLKKSAQQELKIWTQEMDAKWKMFESADHVADELPADISTVHNFLQFSHYENIKNPQVMSLYSEIYDDDCVYQTFIENTLKTRSLLNRKHLVLLRDHSKPQSILNTVNQYDLVWKFHEFLSDYVKLRNLPTQVFPPALFFVVSLDRWFWKPTNLDQTSFKRDNSEALIRLQQLWESYQCWDPPTRGLKQLKNILSVLSLYDDFAELLRDVDYK